MAEYKLSFTAKEINDNLDRIYTLFGDTRDMNVNLLDFTQLNHQLRYSPGNGAIVSSSGTQYSLFVLKLVPNSIYRVSTAIGGYGLFKEYPSSGSIALYKQAASGNTATEFNSGNYTYLAINIYMTNANSSTTIENPVHDRNIDATIMRIKVNPILYITEDQMFEVVGKSYNMINPSMINYYMRHSTGSMALVRDSLPIASSGLIEVEEGQTYTINTSTLYNRQGGYYDADAQHKAGQKAVENIEFFDDTTKTGSSFTVPTGKNIKYVCLSLKTNEDKTGLLVAAQLEIGGTATDYQDYAEQVRINKKLLPETEIPDIDINTENLVEKDDLFKYHSFNMMNPANFKLDRRYSTGSLKLQAESSLKIASSGMIEVEEGEWYTVSGAGLYSGYQGGFFGEHATDDIGVHKAIQNITFTAPVTGSGRCFQVPTGLGIKYALISLATTADRTAIAGDIQMELGEMATAYVPYELKTSIKDEYLPSSGSGSASVTDNAELIKYTTFGNLHYSGIDEKIANFKKHWYRKDKDICVVNTGTSLTARSIEHCTEHRKANKRPPLMHSNNFASHIWDALVWPGQQYRRFDSGFFTEVGTFTLAGNLDNWDDGPYRSGLTKYIDGAASVSYTLPADAWQANFIYRTDNVGSEACTVTITEGNGLVVVKNEAGEWVEANGYVFSQRESDPTTIPTVTYTVPENGNTNTIENYQTKGNTTYQKRLYMKCVDRTAEKTITISSESGRFMYWGVEWSPREFMITYINAARGSHSSAVSTATTALNHYQDNEIWSFNPDLILTEDPIHNAGGGGKPGANLPTTRYGQITENFFFADNNISLKARAEALGKPVPEMVIFNSTNTYNFGAFDTETGEYYFTQMKDGPVWCGLDSQMSCYTWVKEKHPEVVYINAIKHFYEACINCYGDMATATKGSGKNGLTFTNEGSHWNDTGCKVMARAVLPVLDMNI